MKLEIHIQEDLECTNPKDSRFEIKKLFVEDKESGQLNEVTLNCDTFSNDLDLGALLFDIAVSRNIECADFEHGNLQIKQLLILLRTLGFSVKTKKVFDEKQVKEQAEKFAKLKNKATKRLERIAKATGINCADVVEAFKDAALVASECGEPELKFGTKDFDAKSIVTFKQMMKGQLVFDSDTDTRGKIIDISRAGFEIEGGIWYDWDEFHSSSEQWRLLQLHQPIGKSKKYISWSVSAVNEDAEVTKFGTKDFDAEMISLFKQVKDGHKFTDKSFGVVGEIISVSSIGFTVDYGNEKHGTISYEWDDFDPTNAPVWKLRRNKAFGSQGGSISWTLVEPVPEKFTEQEIRQLSNGMKKGQRIKDDVEGEGHGEIDYISPSGFSVVYDTCNTHYQWDRFHESHPEPYELKKHVSKEKGYIWWSIERRKVEPKKTSIVEYDEIVPQNDVPYDDSNAHTLDENSYKNNFFERDQKLIDTTEDFGPKNAVWRITWPSTFKDGTIGIKRQHESGCTRAGIPWKSLANQYTLTWYEAEEVWVLRKKVLPSTPTKDESHQDFSGMKVGQKVIDDVDGNHVGKVELVNDAGFRVAYNYNNDVAYYWNEFHPTSVEEYQLVKFEMKDGTIWWNIKLREKEPEKVIVSLMRLNPNPKNKKWL